MPKFVLHVKDIDDDGKDYAFAVETAWMRSALADTDLRPVPDAADGSLRLRAQLNGAEVLITGSLQAELETDCVRCLEPVPLGVDAPFTVLMAPAGARRLPKELELQPEDLDTVPFKGDDIVLDDMVREQLVVEAPMQPRCAQPCELIEIPERVRPPQDVFGGADDGGKPVDPRFAALAELKNKLPSRKE
jgi:uncharacterized protein